MILLCVVTAANPRQDVLDALAAGDISFVEALGDARACRVPLVALIEAIAGLGPARTATVLERAGIAPWLEAREVTERQRVRLVCELQAFAAAAGVL